MKKGKIITIIIASLLVVSVLFNVYNILYGKIFSITSDQYSMTKDSSDVEYGGLYESDSNNGIANTEMLIINSNITIKADNNGNIDTLIRAYVKDNNGKIINSYDYLTSQDYKVYTLEVKIPQDLYNDFMEYLKQQGEVVNLYENSYDVANQYNDNQLRITLYENKLARLYELLDQSADMSDLITIENAISDTIYQIESLKSTQGDLEYNNEYASVSITINPIIKETVEASGLDGIFGDAFTSSINGFILFITWFIKIIFYIIPYTIIVVMGYVVYRKIKKNKQNKVQK